MLELVNTYSPWLMGAVYLAGGIHHLTAPPSMKDIYVGWGYPRWFPYVTAVLELAAVALLVPAQTRVYGVALGGAVMLAAVATLVRHREYKKLPPALVILILAVLWLVPTI